MGYVVRGGLYNLWQKEIRHEIQRAEEHHRVLDEAIAEDVARGADDNED